MEREEERKFVIELLKEGNNDATIRKINANFPQLGDKENTDKFKDIVKKLIYKDQPRYDMYANGEPKLILQKYPQRGTTVIELKIRVREW